MTLNTVTSMNKKERQEEEESHNMEYFCEHHSKERHKEWQDNNKDVKVRPGDHIKVGFPAHLPGEDKHNLTVEWMWVEVRSIQKRGLVDERIVGVLDNEPVYITRPPVHYRKIIVTFRDEIADLITGNWKPGV